MRLVAGSSLMQIHNRAIDEGLSLSAPLSERSAAVGLLLPEYVVGDFLVIKDLSVWRWPIPDGGYELQKDGTRLCTPELSFLLLARLLSVEQLALYGLEVCGTYAIDVNSPRGFISDVVPETSTEKLAAFLKRCPNAPGSRVAKQALKWITGKSASPMESVLVLLLCLPRRLGGFGLPMPELNLSVDELNGMHDSGHGPYMDLVWRDKRFSLEYDSDMEHTGHSRIARDSKRRVRLAEEKVRSLSVTIEQIKDSYELMRVARLVSAALGKKFHGTGAELRRRNAALRQLLIDLTKVE